jgi:tetratricopeptide (TPR) repeat protein
MNYEQWRHYYRGYFFELFRRPDRAIAEYKLALRAEPQFARAAACIAHMHAAQEQYDEAERYFREALRLSPANAETLFNLGYVYERQRKHEQAIAAFGEALKLKPKIDRAWYGMGMSHAALGRHDEAAKALEEATTLQPMNGHAWYAYGMAQHHLHHPGKVKDVVMHLHRIDPIMCRRLIQEAERSDLAHLVKDLMV